MGEGQKEGAPVLHLIGLYFLCNWGLNLVNKYVLGATHLPLLLTFTHMVFSTLVLLPVMLRRPFSETHVATLRESWGGIVCIGSLMAVNIALSNASLVSLTLSLNQVIRAAMPVMTVLLAIFIEGQTPTLSVFASLTVLSTGVAACVWDSQASGTLPAIYLCILSTVASAACYSASGRLFAKKIDVLPLTFYVSPICALAIMPCMLYYEGRRLLTIVPYQANQIIGMFLASSLLAVSHNLINYKLVQHTSAVSATVIGEVKTIMLIVLSAFLLGEKKIFTPRLTVGCVVAMMGFCWYSHCKLASSLTATKVQDDESTPSRDEEAQLLAVGEDTTEP